ncbi:zinc finger, CCHC-type containing protein [Tanacetum coccineum]
MPLMDVSLPYYEVSAAVRVDCLHEGNVTLNLKYQGYGPQMGVLTEEEQRKRDQDETLCWGYILSTPTDRLKKLMHTSEDFTLDQIQKHLRIEEETRIREKNLNDASSSKKDESANAVEQVDTIEITAMVFEMNIGMIQELHMASVTTTTDDWWYDSGATIHVCNNRDLFKTYKETEDGHEVIMGDNHTSKVIGSGNVEIQFTSGKKLILMNVLYVPNIRKNIVSGFKLCKSRVKAVIELDKVILSKANVYIGKAYAYDGMFKLNINKITSSAYLPDYNFIFNLDSNVIVESRDVDFFENKFCHDSKSTNEIVTQISQDISGPDLNSNNKRNMAESSSAPRKSKGDRKEINLDLDFIDSQAIIFLKYHTDGSIQTFKARLLIQGFSQRQRVDYFDTYALVARITLIRLLFALALIYNLPIHQMDVKTAFLNGDLDEKVYMKQPEGFVLPGHENKMKDMNEVDTISGIKLKRYNGGYALNQCHYINKIIDEFQHLNIEEANTPYESSCKLVENDGRVVAQIEYASAIGKEAEWLRNMLLDIELWPQPILDIFLHCDSQSTLSRAYNKVYNGKSIHISLRYAYIKELISNGIITIEYIRFCKNLVDPFTKGLSKDIVFGTTREMGLKPIEQRMYLCGYKEWCRSYKGELLLGISMKLGLAHGHNSATML